jgi:putative ABC transport system substrate-binding protein
MRWRDFITVLARPQRVDVRSACAKCPAHNRLSERFFHPGLPGTLTTFYQGLKETGFVEGKDIGVEFRWADGHYDRLPLLVAEVVDRNASVIFAGELPSAFTAKAATKTIPIVFVSGADPVKVGRWMPMAPLGYSM